jgi:CHAT domain-containing protein
MADRALHQAYLTTSEIGIIPHGVLHYLPFAALTDGQRYLSDDHTLFALPSASVLKFVRKSQNPDNGDKSSSLRHAQDTARKGKREGTVLALANGLAKPPLYDVDQEVKAIARRYPTQLLIGPKATEAALRAREGSFSILHLAAHGVLNTTSPLFSHIVLAPDAEHDGKLDVREVYDLNLQHTELMVLSACDTQLGERSAGDDIIGINRAFMYAGTPSVIASLWKINDRVTVDFMTSFYASLKGGNSKAKALQFAQQKTRDRYSHPYYWAAFVLTGDPGTTRDRFSWLIVLIIGLIIAGILGIIIITTLPL